MSKQLSARATATITKAAGAGLLTITVLAVSAMPGFAQATGPHQYGEAPGVEGQASATVNIEKGNYGTLIAVVEASGGQLVGEGTLARAGLGVDIYVDDDICTADRDIPPSGRRPEFQRKVRNVGDLHDRAEARHLHDSCREDAYQCRRLENDAEVHGSRGQAPQNRRRPGLTMARA